MLLLRWLRHCASRFSAGYYARRRLGKTEIYPTRSLREQLGEVTGRYGGRNGFDFLGQRAVIHEHGGI